RLTRRLRWIHNAWQFCFESALVFTAQLVRSGGRVVHHLTRRYTLYEESLKIQVKNCSFQR
ncbi:hypothetical protein D5E77_27490, partial [Vibrio parahaemolyticus]